ncbi:hypothetical protein EYF80_009353 [Liparis tanakae]|uniref:Uncharacterized protein n=1 Tax=Liparis tanakae TaxID=230148 RepID=A0A4Z2IQT7_9TELE|nr:hypothetical protein EYF80_009353 [Liparis tanakae]
MAICASATAIGGLWGKNSTIRKRLHLPQNKDSGRASKCFTFYFLCCAVSPGRNPMKGPQPRDMLV